MKESTANNDIGVVIRKKISKEKCLCQIFIDINQNVLDFSLWFLNEARNRKENWRYVIVSYRLQRVTPLTAVNGNPVFLFSSLPADWKASSSVSLL